MEKQAEAGGAADGAGPNRKLWGSPTGGAPSGDSLDR